ncbi:hypothetical protein NY78_0363 [Desulfovibrio sp. TomC]|nr:hypothetical protein NY78_0363 [Desulfovibrio sp. TomC]
MMMAVLLAKTMKNVLETPILDKDGAITRASRNVLVKTGQELDNINRM